MINGKNKKENSIAKQIVENYLEKKMNEESDTGYSSPVEAILDENNSDNIFLYDDTGEKVEFEQIAVIPIQEKIYVILRPVVKLPGMAADEALVFFIEDIEDDMCLITEADCEVIDEVFEQYYEMLRCAGVDIP